MGDKQIDSTIRSLVVDVTSHYKKEKYTQVGNYLFNSILKYQMDFNTHLVNKLYEGVQGEGTKFLIILQLEDSNFFNKMELMHEICVDMVTFGRFGKTTIMEISNSFAK